MGTTIKSLNGAWGSLLNENPRLRIRDAAKQLGVSEAELIAIHQHTIRLRPECEEILKAVASLGYVMALTRNEYAVHERKGIYKKVSFNAHVGLVVTPDIDLRLFMKSWTFAFAVNENERKSIQFFANDGSAIHKIYLTGKSDHAAYKKLVDQFKAEEQEGDLIIDAPDLPAVDLPDHKIDVLSFQQAWLDMKDTHAFHGIVLNHKVSRLQALRLAPEGHAVKINNNSVKKVMEEASRKDTEIMVFVGNKGCIQIHTGKTKKLVQAGPWFNVLDPEFNLHLREEGIREVWMVKKPTNKGIVTSIEAFDAEGKIIVQLFGKRKPNLPEREDWRELVVGILP